MLKDVILYKVIKTIGRPTMLAGSGTHAFDCLSVILLYNYILGDPCLKLNSNMFSCSLGGVEQYWAHYFGGSQGIV